MSTDEWSYFKSLHAQRRELLNMLRGTNFTTLSAGISHAQVIPTASYSPWQDDSRFLQLYAAVRDCTLVDVYRSFELWSAAQRTHQIVGAVAEIGVWRGGTAAILCAANHAVRPGESVHLFDTFSGVVKADSASDTLYKGGEHSDASESEVSALLSENGLSNFEIHRGVFPDDSGMFLPSTIRLCHIDVDTYHSAKDCMTFVWPRVACGGMLIFDDYGFWGCEGVTKLLNAEAPSDSLLIHNLNGHGILIKIPSPSTAV